MDVAGSGHCANVLIITGLGLVHTVGFGMKYASDFHSFIGVICIYNFRMKQE